jgi:hypothetical protein
MTCAFASGETRARSAPATVPPVVASSPATTSANLTEFQTSTAFDSTDSAVTFVHDLVAVAGAEGSLVREEQAAGERVS